MNAIVEKVAAAMYEAPAPFEAGEQIPSWPPSHPDDTAWWVSRAVAAIDAVREELAAA